MPRRKGHGIPPTKRVKQFDAISRSAPLKNKLYNEIPAVTAKEESLQMTVTSVPIKSEPPSIISDVLHSKYLHKKFKKMASTLLSEDHHNHINSTLNGSRLKSVSRNSLSPASSDNERASPRISSPRPNVDTPVNSPPAGRYVCSYCKLACSKPSVLQKHIRAHTNERPYPCLPCGFAFKTKSNLYKHCRSRSHASKLEETGEKMPFDGEEGLSSEDDSLSNVSTTASLTSRTELDLDNRDEMPKSIYKPKYRFMEQPDPDLREKTEERKENANSPPHLHLMIPVPNMTQPVSTPSPFTSGSSPSPEFLHRHINKLISENQAIVETNDPFWSKKCLQKTSSNEFFPVSIPTSFSPVEGLHKKTTKSPSLIDSTDSSNCDKQPPKHSKLALALLRPQPPASPKFLNQASMETCDAQPLNLSTNNKEHSSTHPNRKRSYSEGIPERSPKIKERINNNTPLKLHNHSIQDFKRFASTLSENNASVLLNHLDIKKDLLGSSQNPEGSIIKDLLLKARSTNSAINNPSLDSLANSKPLVSLTPPVSDDRSYSPSSQFMCHLCRDSVSYKTAENLEIHQMYHCKGYDASPRSSLNSPSSLPVSPSYNKTQNREASMVNIPSYPSPGPLLGSTPLVDSYRTSPKLHDTNTLTLKRRKYDNGFVESKSIPSTTSRSLEELSKSSMRSNIKMFGGEVKILDHGEAKTLRIEPSNRGNSKNIPLSLSSNPVKPMLKKDNYTDESDSNMVVTIAKQSLHTGGSFMQVPQKNSVAGITTRLVSSSENTVSFSSVQNLSGYQEPNKLMIPIMSNTVTTGMTVSRMTPSVHHPFQFPSMLTDAAPVINPLTNITAFNPLTLPPTAGPHSPGIPSMYSPGIVTILHGGKEIPFVPGMPGPHSTHTGTNFTSKLESETRFSLFSESKSNVQPESLSKSAKHEKASQAVTSSLNIPSLQLNSEKMKSPVESPPRKRSLDETTPSTIGAKPSIPKRTQTFTLPPETKEAETGATEKKFLRPTSLPLKPGTFVPKRQQSTPVLSLVSPETPRPRKSYGQLYLNGHAYTYLGLKCSTRMFFCTLNKPQPIYVPLSPEHNKVSMYSNWKVCTEADPNPCGLNPGRAMALYDSRHRPNTYTLSQIRNSEAVTHSSYWTNRSTQFNREESAEEAPKRVKIFAGGFESNEDYIYVRGRGRGRYVCEECGIRCKKPSMLKKHIRTHTDVRPFTCTQCKFSFKTKGNLTKHMKSKAHYKKCVNMGINPVPTVVDDSNVDEEALARQQALRETRGADTAESEDEDEEEEDETEEEDEDDEDDGYCVEQEAARSLLSLSETLQTVAQRQQVCAGLVAVYARPHTYPYSFTHSAGPATEPQTPTLTAISAQREREKVSQNTIMAREVQQNNTKDEAVISPDQGHYYFSPSQDLADSSREPGQVKQFTPIDLSQRTPEKTTRVCEAAMLLASICSTMERLPISTTAPPVSEDSTLLQAYLTERAMQDSRIKQQQYKPKTHTAEVSPEPEKPSVSKMNISAAKENALGILAQTTSDAHKAPANTGDQEITACSKQSSTPTKPQAEFLPPSSGPSSRYVSILEDGRSMCNICNKVFSKPSQLRLHVNIHYFERPFRCEACAVSFRTSGHLQKHTRSVSHLNKVNMNSTFGTATTTNPRPFKCDDCKIAFRIHGHLAKHLRSKMHIMKLECLGKLPFGTYAELERSGINMNDIDTTDCENSLESLQLLAQKLYEKDPSKLGQWDPAEMMPHHNLSSGETSSEGEEDELPLPTDHPPAHTQHPHPLNHHYSPRSPGSSDRTKTEPPSDRRTSVSNQCC